MNGFWTAYDAMMARIKAEEPANFNELALILADLAEPSAGDAFCLEGGSLMMALDDAGWDVFGIEADYLWEARSPDGAEWLHYVEGDLYRGRR